MALWLTCGCVDHTCGLVRCHDLFWPSGIVTTPVILFSQLHVHIVFDGNRVFQAQMKLWGVSEAKGAQEGGRWGERKGQTAMKRGCLQERSCCGNNGGFLFICFEILSHLLPPSFSLSPPSFPSLLPFFLSLPYYVVLFLHLFPHLTFGFFSLSFMTTPPWPQFLWFPHFLFFPPFLYLSLFLRS